METEEENIHTTRLAPRKRMRRDDQVDQESTASKTPSVSLHPGPTTMAQVDQEITATTTPSVSLDPGPTNEPAASTVVQPPPQEPVDRDDPDPAPAPTTGHTDEARVNIQEPGLSTLEVNKVFTSVPDPVCAIGPGPTTGQQTPAQVPRFASEDIRYKDRKVEDKDTNQRTAGPRGKQIGRPRGARYQEAEAPLGHRRSIGTLTLILDLGARSRARRYLREAVDMGLGLGQEDRHPT